MANKGERYSFREKWFPLPNNDILNKDTDSYDSLKPLMRGVWRWARSIVLGASALWAGYEFIGNNIEYGQGVRTGMINKVSEKGLFWKTYECQMALERIVSGNNSVGANVWDFSIDRQAWHGEDTQELVEKLNDALDSGTKVKAKYIQTLSIWPWRAGTTYLLQDIEPVKKVEDKGD